MYHYTEKAGYNVIHPAPIWLFKASKPPCTNPVGAYFTTKQPSEGQNLKKLRIPKEKREFCFEFEDVGDLKTLDGDRGEYVFYSANHYPVAKARQKYNGIILSWKPT